MRKNSKFDAKEAEKCEMYVGEVRDEPTCRRCEMRGER